LLQYLYLYDTRQHCRKIFGFYNNETKNKDIIEKLKIQKISLSYNKLSDNVGTLSCL